MTTRSDGDHLVDGLATVGRAQSLLGVVLGTIILLPVACVGAWLVLRRRRLTATLIGRIVEANASACVMTGQRAGGGGGDGGLVCSVRYAFRLPRAKEERIKTESVGTTAVPGAGGNRRRTDYLVGDVVTLYYDPAAADPFDTVSLGDDDWRWMGAAVLGGALLFFALAWVKWYLTQRHRAVAAFTGAGAIWDVVTSPRR